MSKLNKIGWDFSYLDVDEERIARVVTVQKNRYRVSDGGSDFLAHVSGKFRMNTSQSLDFPSVGDWVIVDKLPQEQKAVILEILPRKSQFIRQAAGGKTEAQVVGANIDTVFIVNSLNQDLNLRRMERYILSAYDSGASPVIILTKKDECTEEEIRENVAVVEGIAFGIPILTISSLTGDGISELLDNYLPSGKTGALLGSSGVGKSTLVNKLMNAEVQETKSIREADSKGRHTTTHREMFFLPNGALLIDTPGMRELQLWEGEAVLDTAFQDIETLEEECRFADCSHRTEPGCRIKEALDSGELSTERFESYRKLQRELAYEKRKQNKKSMLDEKHRWKQISKEQRHKYKNMR
ncbi:ribosome small subunit-dependent GTPase A [Virgibacillus halodenitrificans]|uniref:ribosome small subunit-dependent GTPase A n=1 Tax=Virgibacillus halodenitrificans TaxID=1482 RepID=UPI0024C00CC5|nr:ribosome small subunit-dependent GTPase A [Virgibacillus halodenitrificans]WHX25255.1 ribosome small subunit-dependent GTPase A [Virgibacillus halodenitrificans]